MYVRDARNRDEAWLLDHIESMGLDDAAFRSRDYVIAVDEDSGDRAGFGRYRVHKLGDEADEERDRLCELTGIGVLETWRGQGVGAHVIERLVQKAGDEGFDTVYSLTDHPDYLEQFGFSRVEDDALPETLQRRLAEKREDVSSSVVGLVLDVDEFTIPDRLRDRFKGAAEHVDADEEPEESPEDFGVDPDEATYKYDTGS